MREYKSIHFLFNKRCLGHLDKTSQQYFCFYLLPPGRNLWRCCIFFCYTSTLRGVGPTWFLAKTHWPTTFDKHERGEVKYVRLYNNRWNYSKLQSKIIKSKCLAYLLQSKLLKIGEFWWYLNYSQTWLNDHLWTTATCQQRPVWVINGQSKSQFYQEPLSNGRFFQVPRVAIVHRFDCSFENVK
jgi:hypothetical protein